MQLIKIDHTTRTVEAIETTATLEEMYRIIGCDYIDVCCRQDNGDALTVDDEALLGEPQPSAFAYGSCYPIHGIALLTGVDEDGETAEPLTSLEEVHQKVTWLGDVETEPSIEVYPISPVRITGAA